MDRKQTPRRDPWCCFFPNISGGRSAETTQQYRRRERERERRTVENESTAAAAPMFVWFFFVVKHFPVSARCDQNKSRGRDFFFSSLEILGGVACPQDTRKDGRILFDERGFYVLPAFAFSCQSCFFFLFMQGFLASM